MNQPTITKDDVLYVAALSKIAVTGPEAEALTKELDAILGFFQQINAVDVTGLKPTYQVTGLNNVMRPDIIEDYGASHDALLKNAPRSQGGSIEVPKVL